MKIKLLFAFALVYSCTIAQPVISLEQYVTGFSSPVDIAHCGDDRLFIVEQPGFIRIIDGQGNKLTQPFLNIDSIVTSGGTEEGLLGVAFHPDYKSNGYFFVYYVNNSSNLVIARFSVTTDPNVADAGSKEIVLTIPHPGERNHNGGNLEFGPDGYLYIATGDGGGAGDPDNSAQDPLSLLGKMLRLDVNTLPYQIPPDNPFVPMSFVRNEIWALGLRNPWRFSFDRLTGDLWIGDVGQGEREEVDFQPAGSTGGENYGWRCYEGNLAYATSECNSIGSYVFPVFDYGNTSQVGGLGCSVVGGYRYRGCKYPNLYGSYLFADYCSGRFWTLRDSSGTWVSTHLLNEANSRYSTIGEDMNGELYVAGVSNGIIYRLKEASVVNVPAVTISGDTDFCLGDSAVLSTQATAGFASYAWLHNGAEIATGLQLSAKDSGAYYLLATGVNGCFYTSPTTTITTQSFPGPTIQANGNTLSANESSAGYQWFFSVDGLDPAPLVNATTQQITATNSGFYYATLVDSIGCRSLLSEGERIIMDGIEETWLENISLQPNPFTNEILLNYTLQDAATVRISMHDIAGKEIAVLVNERKNTGSQMLTINTAQYHLSKGIYLLEITNGASKKVLKLEKM